MLLRQLGFDHRSSHWSRRATELGTIELAPHADMHGHCIKAFRPTVVGDLIGVTFVGITEPLEVNHGIPCERRPN